MTRPAALRTLQVLSQWQTHPVLTGDELEVCLDLAQCGAEAWDIATAAAQAWLLKAGKSSDHHGSTIDGRRFDAQQVQTNCLAMHKHFRNQIVGTYTVESA